MTEIIVTQPIPVITITVADSGASISAIGAEEITVTLAGDTALVENAKIRAVQAADAAEASAAIAAAATADFAGAIAATAADVVTTGADRVQTGLDAVATAADRVQTGLDVISTAANAITASDAAVLIAASTGEAAASAASASADAVQTSLDVVATSADVLLTAADVVLTHADVVLTTAAVIQTGLDVVSTAADAAATAQDSIDSAAYAVLTAADRVQTGLDATSTAAAESATAGYVTAAQAARDATLAALDSFDDRYLGAFAVAPTLDNDGNALVSGALYFNSASNAMNVWDGASWLAAYASLSGALIATANLSDLTNLVSARSNLELGSAALAASTSFATSAQGSAADTAFGWGDHSTQGYGTSTEGTAVLSTGEIGGSKFLRENGIGGATWAAIPGAGDALTTNPLSQFAATTSAQLAGVVSDETGSGALVFGTAPTLQHPTLQSEAAPTPTDGMIYLDSTTNKIVARENGAWAEMIGFTNRSTGLIAGGVLSIGTPNTTFSITDGRGVVLDHTTNPAIPTDVAVSWTGKTNIPVTNIATQLITYVCIDAGGNVLQESTKPSAATIRSCIFLGVIVHVNGSTVNAVNQSQSVALAPVSQLHDLASAIGFFNISGNIFSVGTTSGLYVNKSAGNIFAMGSNWANSTTNPNVLSISAQADLGFQYRSRTGLNRIGTPQGELVIDPNIYDSAGTFAVVPTNKWTIQRVYVFLSGDVKLQPGQNIYNSYADALAGLSANPFVTEPSILGNGLLRGFVIVQQGTITLSSTNFLEAEKFGSSTGTGASVGSEFEDSTFAIFDQVDATKIIAFEASGITTGTTRTLTAPDASGILMLTSAIGTTVQAYDATYVVDADIGVTVQAYSAVLAGTTESFTTAFKSNYDTAFGWGNHAIAGYLTSETSHADVLVDADIGVTVQAYDATAYLPLAGGTVSSDLIVNGQLTLAGTGAALLPSGTTAQRPTPSNGMLRYNATDAAFEGYAAGAWGAIGGGGGGLTYVKTNFIATAAQTTFTVAYTVGYVDVYLNGARLIPSDFTATNGTSIVLVTGANLNDEIEVVAFETFNVANAIVAADLIGHLQTTDIGATVQAYDPAIARTATFIASGTIASAGLVVSLNTDGTVSAVSDPGPSVGTAVSMGTDAYDIAATYDSTNGKVVLAYQDASNSNYGTAVVGTVSGTSISFGTPVVFESAVTYSISATYDSANGKVVIAYRDNGNSDFGTAVVGTVSGTSISFGTAVVFESAATTTISTTYDSANGKVVIAYRDSGNGGFGTAIVGTVSGTSISFGTAVVFESANTYYISAVYDSANGKIVIAYQDGANANYGTAIVGNVSGTSISFGTAVVFESANTYYISAVYDSGNGRVIIAYADNGNSSYGTVIVGAVSGTSISFLAPTVFYSTNISNSGITALYAANKTVISYGEFNTPYYGESVVYSSGLTNRLNTLGIAQSSATDANPVEVKLPNQVDANQTGLTSGSYYYVADDGTLSKDTAGTLVGKAVSSTELLITNWSQ